MTGYKNEMIILFLKNKFGNKKKNWKIFSVSLKDSNKMVKKFLQFLTKMFKCQLQLPTKKNNKLKIFIFQKPIYIYFSVGLRSVFFIIKLDDF